MDKEHKPKSLTHLCDLNRNARVHRHTRQDEIYVHGYCLPSDATSRLENVNRMLIATELQPTTKHTLELRVGNGKHVESEELQQPSGVHRQRSLLQ